VIGSGKLNLSGRSFTEITGSGYGNAYTSTSASFVVDVFVEVLPSEEGQISVDSRAEYVRESRVSNSTFHR